MAKETLLTCVVKLATVDYSNFFRSITLEASRDLKEVQCFGDLYKVFVNGLSDWTVSLNFVDDYADNAWNEVAWGMWSAAVPIAFECRPKSSAVAPANPQYSGNVIMNNFPILTAEHGEVSAGSFTLQGTGLLSRAVA